MVTLPAIPVTACRTTIATYITRSPVIIINMPVAGSTRSTRRRSWSQALVALVTGTTLGVGQVLPAGYDVYNVPYAYRSTYFDRDDAWYRYDDGYIYEVDPRTRIIQTAMPVAYDGYTVGYPMPTLCRLCGARQL